MKEPIAASDKLTAKDNSKELRGKHVVEFFPFLCRIHPEITELRFTTYHPEPKLSERLGNMLTPEEIEIRDAADKICKENGIPFWDAVLGILMKRGTIPERLVETAMAHGAVGKSRTSAIQRADVSIDRINTLIREVPDEWGLVVNGRVRVGNQEEMHIPMLDFRCPCSQQNAAAIKRMITLIGHQSGILVESGRSYHFYGTTLLTEEQWVMFMGKALLFAPFTDPRYVAHRLADRECRLKIYDRKGSIPLIVDAFSVASS